MNAATRRNLRTTSIHAMALDGIVNVNSLFTVATFLGLALNPTNHTLLDSTKSSSSCTPTTSVAEHLVTFHVYSFSSFLFSSLVASALKQAVKTADDGDNPTAQVSLKALRAGILASAAGSVSGCVCLMLALVDLIQIKLGVLSCWSWYTLAAVAPLVTLVPSALVAYICLVLHAFTRRVQKPPQNEVGNATVIRFGDHILNEIPFFHRSDAGI
ncbi:hypothetical protein RHGRI_036291 [Rhododendron griersonianum]|uniref:Maternal effect embryo arrest 60 n=1 Tax=Rhododendron griersonianum TaxID=479676 RepID=A0AAV6HQH2_9ERIC|nr:hypothetical protein RHGRI_036291 [Rhododendron griersonianum]